MAPPLPATDERGFALPMALMVLVLLATLMLVFSSLTRTEPIIAANQLRTSQARALAESGLERALWALSNPTHPAGLADPLPSSPAPVPYDGNTFVEGGRTGGFTVEVADSPGGDPGERLVTATGWTPTSSPLDRRTKAHRRVQARVAGLPDLARRAPCALCARGALELGAGVSIDAAADTSCGDKSATYGGPPEGFDALTLRAASLSLLRSLARRNGTYYRGAVTFDASHQMRDGVVFVDTTSGADATASTPASELASVAVHDGAFAAGAFRGWLVVNGALGLRGDVRLDGTVYVADELRYEGAGGIRGLVISQNVREGSVTRLAATAPGGALVTFDCARARARAVVPASWAVVAGSYREVSD
ncbi:MAG TPA: hypothetical protein VFX28_19895 [Methylomirabilota bacterium]|nr:hypothetical protein [Methylomirabilota bacterium]